MVRKYRQSPTAAKSNANAINRVYKGLKIRSLNSYEPSYWKSPYATEIRALRWKPFIPKPWNNKKYHMLNKFQGVPQRRKMQIGNKFQQRAAFSYTDASNIRGKIKPEPLDRISTIKTPNPDDHQTPNYSPN